MPAVAPEGTARPLSEPPTLNGELATKPSTGSASVLSSVTVLVLVLMPVILAPAGMPSPVISMPTFSPLIDAKVNELLVWARTGDATMESGIAVRLLLKLISPVAAT